MNHRLRVMRSAKILLVFSALILATGAVAHALAFRHALSALATVKLSAGMSGSFKALWLADSTTCMTAAVIFILIAARPPAIADGRGRTGDAHRADSGLHRSLHL